MPKAVVLQQYLQETLFTFLERAEAKVRRVTQGEGLVGWENGAETVQYTTEQLDSDREGRFAEQEQRAAKKAMMDDVS